MPGAGALIGSARAPRVGAFHRVLFRLAPLLSAVPASSLPVPAVSMLGGGDGAGSRTGVAAGETVGVILLGPGGPASLREAEGFAARLVSDVRRVPLPLVPAAVQRRLAPLGGRLRRRRLRRELRALGGQTPEGAHTADVADALERTLNRRTFPAVVWQVTTAFRYGGRTLAEARASLVSQGVDRVLVVPFAPPGLRTVAASLRETWTDAGGDAAALVAVPPLADTLADAVRERLCEAVQRFPEQVRVGLHVLFAVHPAARADSAAPEDAPVAAVLRHLADADLPGPRHVAFGRTWGLSLQAAPGVEDELAALAEAGVRSLLVVPVGYLCDSMDTAYELDVAMRARALDLGMLHVEVAAPMGPHAVLLDALAERLADALAAPATELAAAPAADAARQAA